MWFCCLVAQSCLTLCNPMDCSTTGFPVLHHLLEFAQSHVHWVSDAIQPSHPLSSPSPPAFNLSQHQDLFLIREPFASGGQSIGASASASVLLMNIQDWFPLGLTGWISLQSKGLSRVFSRTIDQAYVISQSHSWATLQAELSEIIYKTSGSAWILTTSDFLINPGTVICFYWHIWFNNPQNEDLREDKITTFISPLGKKKSP